MEAARRLKSQGWRVRMRIDPIILGFDYSWIINQLKELAPERVTLGTLRSEANLWRFVNNGLFAALEKPSDPKGMARYPFDQRLGLYRPAVEALSGVCPLGLCEETPDMWEALGLDKDAKSCNCGA
jgi:DNA repair photolyase